MLFGPYGGSGRNPIEAERIEASDRCDGSKMALMVAAFAADLSKAAAYAHLAAGMVSSRMPMLWMDRAVTSSLVSLTRRIGTAGHHGDAKAYAVQHHRKRRQ
jgi:hypothetical protein